MSLHVHCCLTAALLLAGCRESTDRIQTFPARGQVLWEGQPLAGALVVLHPQSTSAPAPLPARAETDAQGNFILGTYDSEDGVPAGDYVITVHWHQLAQDGRRLRVGPMPPLDRLRDANRTRVIVGQCHGRTRAGLAPGGSVKPRNAAVTTTTAEPCQGS